MLMCKYTLMPEDKQDIYRYANINNIMLVDPITRQYSCTRANMCL